MTGVTCIYYVLPILDEDGNLDISHCTSFVFTTSCYHVTKHLSADNATILLIGFGKWEIWAYKVEYYF